MHLVFTVHDSNLQTERNTGEAELAPALSKSSQVSTLKLRYLPCGRKKAGQIWQAVWFDLPPGESLLEDRL